MKTDELIAKAAAEATGLQLGDLFFFVFIPVIIILGLIYARAKNDQLRIKKSHGEERGTADPLNPVNHALSHGDAGFPED